MDLEQLVLALSKLKTKSNQRINKVKRKFCREKNISMPGNAELLSVYRKLINANKLKQDTSLEQALQKRKIRTLSGVAPVAVLTKPYPCPGQCIYCPDEAKMPKSYLSNEPAVMRAVLTGFHPYKQVKARLKALENNGHNTEKIELIIMGGTWSYLPRQYQNWFVRQCFNACNHKKSTTLEKAQKLNETAKHRIVALTVETRPDYVDEQEIKYWRKLGATKVELGVQTLDDKILKLNKRGHTVKETIKATKLLKMAGFKIAYHMMPNLPGSTPTKDLQVYKKLFTDPKFQPDFVKIYPTVVTKNSILYRWWKQGKYKPYSDKQLFNLLLKIKLATPDRVRIIRLIRDIPGESIIAGNKITNLRQNLQKELKKREQACQCIRCREAGENIKNIKQAQLFTEKYQASGAEEYFLQYCSKDKEKLYAFLRLRLPEPKEKNFIPEIDSCAMIREIHTYGRLIPLSSDKTKGVQHQGFGRQLMKKTEEIAKKNNFEKIAVISGVGVRGYYRQLGYRRQGSYMIKKLK